jgi:hypothetical protein
MAARWLGVRNESDGEAAETGMRRSGSVSAMRASQSVIRSALYHIEAAELPMIFLSAASQL